MTSTNPPRRRIGLVVDAQEDFLRPALPGGRLYVHHLDDARDAGAEAVIPRIAAAARALDSMAALVVYTGDWHRDDDAEIDAVSPDFASTYPPHCMGASHDASLHAGAALVPEVAPRLEPLVLGRDATPTDGAALALEAWGSGRPVFLQKSRFSAFHGNRGTDAFITELARLAEDPEFVVCGVATDVCVTQAVEGLRERGHPVAVVTDAVWGLGAESERLTRARWAAAGVTTMKTADIARPAPPTAALRR